VDEQTAECIMFINYRVVKCYLRDKQLDQSLELVEALWSAETENAGKIDALELKCKILLKFM